MERRTLPTNGKAGSVSDVQATEREAYDRIILNVSPELAKRVRDLARQERRSISKQAEVLIERALAMEQVAA